jgi:hypothetical protein
MKTAVNGGLVQPEVLILCPSGGTHPVTGEPSLASFARLRRTMWLADEYRRRGYSVRVLVSGEQTRKSGDWPQCEKLAAYLAPKLSPDVTLEALPHGPRGVFEYLLLRDDTADEVVFVNDAAYIAYYRDALILENAAFGRWIRYEAVPMQVEYYERYSRDFVRCYRAALYAKLAMDYAKAKNLGVVRVGLKAAALCLRAVMAVGYGQFKLFVQDRQLNKESEDPAVKAKVAYLGQHLRKDLLGEND